MFKYLSFNAGKTSHLDRLCLENSLKASRANVGRLFVVKEIILRLSTNVLLLSLLQIMFKGNRNSMITMFFFLVHYFRQM